MVELNEIRNEYNEKERNKEKINWNIPTKTKVASYEDIRNAILSESVERRRERPEEEKAETVIYILERKSEKVRSIREMLKDFAEKDENEGIFK